MCHGEDSDAVSAYTQCDLGGEETWISLVRGRRPESWDKFDEPVCLLVKSLYGHPKAGLYWETHCAKNLLMIGWEKVKGWECLFVHRQSQLFLSVYVDDFKMSGKKQSLAAMWDKRGEHLELDKPTPMPDNVYLGCAQKDIGVPEKLVLLKQQMHNGHRRKEGRRHNQIPCSYA